MGKVNTKTNAMRILDNLGIPYETLEYKVDELHLDAVHVAKEAGIPIEQVFKTIVMITSDKRLFVFCTPAEFDISLKKARELTHSKVIDLLPLNQLQKMTGYIRGGCSPLGMIRQYRTFIEETALLNDFIYVSAGLRGLQIKINPDDLAKACNATFESFI